MLKKLEGKTFIVTGSTQGIGEGIAKKLADRGARGVAITGRNADNGRRVCADLETRGCAAFFVPGELAVEEDCRKIVRAADERFGWIDGLVNAAGVTTRGNIENTTVELWDKIFAVNVRAPFILTQEVVRVMRREKKGGSIVNVISMSSHGGQPFLLPYSTSKGALAVMTKNLAHALRKDRIRVNGINLGWATTPGEDVVQKEEGAPADWLAKAEERQPFGRLIRPRDVGVLSAYLLSDDAEMMTGSLIDFDQNVMGAYE